MRNDQPRGANQGEDLPRRRPGLLILLFAFVAGGTALHADDWVLKKNEASVQIFTRTVKDSPIVEFRGVTRIRTSVSAVEALIQDITAAPRWIEYAKEGRLLKQADDESLTYTVTSLPWPLQARDAVVHNKQTKYNGMVSITFEAEPDAIPADPKLVRIRVLSGSWLLRADGDFVEVAYTVHSDPGGNLPGWLVNLGIVDQPFQTLKHMAGMLALEPYKSAGTAATTEVKP